MHLEAQFSESDPEQWLIRQARHKDPVAWEELIGRYEGRLFAFVQSRIQDRMASEDLVQETFLGLWNSLPNYDGRTPLESFLFAIAAHKIVDHLRKRGRVVPVGVAPVSSIPEFIDLKARVASSIARSAERRDQDSKGMRVALQAMVAGWIQRHEWERLKCAELLLVKRLSNQQVARILGITEQGVANHKHYVLQKLRTNCQSEG